MKIDFETGHLIYALSKLVHICEDKPLLPKDAYLRISRPPNRRKHVLCSVFARHVEAHALVEASVVGEGVIATPLLTIIPLARSLPLGRATITLAGGSARLKAQQGDFQLKVYPDDQIFPQSNPDDWVMHRLSMVPFMRSLEITSITHTRGGKPYADLTYLDFRDVAASDGYRMAICPNEACELEHPVLLPAEATAKMLKVFQGVTGDALIGVDAGSLSIKYGTFFFRTQTSAKSFPHFRQVLPTTDAARAEVDGALITQVLTRLSIMLPDRSAGFVTCHFGKGKIYFEVVEESGEKSAEAMPASSDFEGVIGLNIKFFREAVSSLRAQKVTLEYRGSMSPVVITDGRARHVLQPVSIAHK